LWKFLGVATREERRHPSHLLAHSHFIELAYKERNGRP
jgi:hypothetical protein